MIEGTLDISPSIPKVYFILGVQVGITSMKNSGRLHKDIINYRTTTKKHSLDFRELTEFCTSGCLNGIALVGCSSMGKGTIT